MALVTVSNLSRYFAGKAAVKNADFQLEKGKTVALIGPNGAGKTTALRMMAGLLKPTQGKIQLSGMNQNSDIRSYIGYLPQHPVFFGWMTGREFLVYSGQLAKLSKEDAKKRAKERLKQVGISEDADKQIARYSGGMKQRLGIAQALIHKPQLLILDEPVSSLDPIGRRDVLTLMEELKQDMTVLFSTHILGDAEEVSDELLLMHDGAIVESGSLQMLRGKYQTNKLEMTFADELAFYQSAIGNLQSVSECYIEKDMLYIEADDLGADRSQILHTIADNNWPLMHFNVSHATLEDMFMKVVKQ